jgi:hypothetical protein
VTKPPNMPEDYDKIRTGIVELLKAARSAAARKVKFTYDCNLLGNWSAHC